MKIEDLTSIPDPVQRFAQSQRFLRALEKTESLASVLRDEALLELRGEGLSQNYIANLIGVSQQRVSQMIQRAEARVSGENE